MTKPFHKCPECETPKKVSVIGAGHIGSHVALFTLVSKLVTKVWLSDQFYLKVQGECMDINATLQALKIEADCLCTSNPSDLKGSDIVAVCVGRRRIQGEVRTDLYEDNKESIRLITNDILEYCPKATVLVVTNPSDDFTDYMKGFGVRAYSIGTDLDTARLRNMIHENTNKPSGEIEDFVMGKHGEDMEIISDISDDGKEKASQIAIETIRRKQSTVISTACIVYKTISEF